MTCCTRTKNVCACATNASSPWRAYLGMRVLFFLSFFHLYLSDEQSQVGPSQLRS